MGSFFDGINGLANLGLRKRKPKLWRRLLYERVRWAGNGCVC